jgi:apolipoprotein N-acyltransferase
VFPADSSDVRALVEGYLPAIERLAAEGAEVVVLPELVARLEPGDPTGLVAAFADAARRDRLTLVVGVSQAGEPRDRDVALVFGPDGRLEASYDKHHRIPGLEDHYQKGTDLVLLGPESRWGIQICKDLDFPALSAAYAARGAGLLLVPAWDKVQDGWLHARMAVMRGVEQGFAVARAAKEGSLTLSDRYGRVLAEGRSAEREVAWVAGDLPVGGGGTTYGRVGDWFGWAAVGLLAGLVALARRPRRPSA